MRSDIKILDGAQYSDASVGSLTVEYCSIVGVFGVQWAQLTVHNWVHKVDLQPESGKNLDNVTVDETVIQFNDEQYRVYAVVMAETNELLYTTLESTRNMMIAQQFLTELSEKDDISGAVFLIGGVQSLKAACH